MNLSDRMVEYEGRETHQKFMQFLPIMVRIDGKCFHKFVKDVKAEYPYDTNLRSLFIATTQYLMEETGFTVGYTQSDEITLAWYSEDFHTELPFGGKKQKIISVLSSMATMFFNEMGNYVTPAVFDARAWQVPNLWEAVNVFTWREADAVRNSISMAARAFYSHKQLLGKSSAEMHEMLFQKGVNWNDYPSEFKRGVYLTRRTIRRKFSAEEISLLPEKHEARRNPDLEIERSSVSRLDIPPISQMFNPVEILFKWNPPKLERRKNNVNSQQDESQRDPKSEGEEEEKSCE